MYWNEKCGNYLYVFVGTQVHFIVKVLWNFKNRIQNKGVLIFVAFWIVWIQYIFKTTIWYNMANPKPSFGIIFVVYLAVCGSLQIGEFHARVLIQFSQLLLNCVFDVQIRCVMECAAVNVKCDSVIRNRGNSARLLTFCNGNRLEIRVDRHDAGICE